jgi:outer membrane protein assembly factor BamD (BamD/ComL family)
VSEQKVYRILQVTFIAIAVVCFLTSALIFTDGTSALKTYLRAWRLLYEHDYASAVEGLEACVARRPQSSSCWIDLARARFHAGDHRGAAEAYEIFWSMEGGVESPDGCGPVLVYLDALAEGEQPIGPLPRPFEIDAPARPPDEYRDARRALDAKRYEEAAQGFEACLGRMPGTPGEMDALWGLAIARFHAGDFAGSLEALDRIREVWGKQPSEAFEAVVAYVKAVAAGEKAGSEMPPILALYAPTLRSERCGRGSRP